MKIKDIYDFLDTLSPFSTQEKWDNSGLIVGNMENDFQQVYISLDLDEKMLDDVIDGSLIITHHPLIFAPLRTINYDSYATKILKILIKKDIKLISMHTNIDKSHLNKFVFENILGFKLDNENEFICYAKVNMSFEELSKLVKEKLNLGFSKVVKCHDNIQKIAMTTGSGMSLINEINADCFLTADIKYHDAMEADSRKISLIDIGHWESEVHFIPLIMGLVEKYLKKNEIKAIITASKNPFEYNDYSGSK